MAVTVQPLPVTRELAPSRARDWAAPGAVLLLLYAGYFKADPLLSWVPADLTVAGAVLAACGIAAVLLTTGAVPRGTMPVLALWAAFIPAAIFHAPAAYGSAKTAHLFTLSLLAALGPVFLLRTQARLEAWVVLQIALGAVLATGAWLSPPPQLSTGEIYRLALQGSTSIGTGRAAGVAVAGCFALAIAGHRRKWWLALAGAALSVPLFASGSRGPVLAAGAAVLIVAAMAPASAARRSVRIAFAVAGTVLAWLYVRGDSSGAAGRIASTLLTGSDQGASSQTRLQLWHYSWAYIQGHPLGAGWGGLPGVSGFRLLAGNGLLYPHNVLAEVTAEGGWIAGIALAVFMWCALRRLRAASGDPYPAALFGMAVFAVMNAMVSGDVNGNRVMWASLAIAWAVSAPRQDDQPRAARAAAAARAPGSAATATGSP
jgi:hypothetical protein